LNYVRLTILGKKKKVKKYQFAWSDCTSSAWRKTKVGSNREYFHGSVQIRTCIAPGTSFSITTCKIVKVCTHFSSHESFKLLWNRRSPRSQARSFSLAWPLYHCKKKKHCLLGYGSKIREFRKWEGGLECAKPW
jgi:hypothetical protein